MSNLMFGPDVAAKFVDKRKAGAQTAATSLATAANYASQATLDARLTALGFSASTLSLMTLNDKVFAVRSADDSASI